MRKMLFILGWRHRLSSGSGGVGSSYADLLNSSGGGAGVTSNEDMPLTDVGRMVTGLLDVLDGCFNILAGGDSRAIFFTSRFMETELYLCCTWSANIDFIYMILIRF